MWAPSSWSRVGGGDLGNSSLARARLPGKRPRKGGGKNPFPEHARRQGRQCPRGSSHGMASSLAPGRGPAAPAPQSRALGFHPFRPFENPAPLPPSPLLLAPRTAGRGPQGAGPGGGGGAGGARVPPTSGGRLPSSGPGFFLGPNPGLRVLGLPRGTRTTAGNIHVCFGASAERGKTPPSGRKEDTGRRMSAGERGDIPNGPSEKALPRSGRQSGASRRDAGRPGRSSGQRPRQKQRP